MSERGELVARLHTIGLPTARDAISQIERDGLEIERLSAENERLRATLSAITATDCYSRDECTAMARAALNPEDET